MWTWFRSFWSPAPSQADSKSETQQLRLELEECRTKLATVQDQYKRQHAESAEYIEQAVNSKLQALMSAVANPVTQLNSQIHLHQNEGKEARVQTLITLSRQMMRALQDEGLELKGTIGEEVPFDPNQHEMLGDTPAVAEKTSVVVRVAGVQFAGKWLRRMGVVQAS